jgi:hypothetical protein
MKNLLLHLKAVKTGTHKAYVGAGAGVETNSFGSATLALKKPTFPRNVISSLGDPYGQPDHLGKQHVPFLHEACGWGRMLQER